MRLCRQFLSALSTYANVAVVSAKADTMTVEEISAYTHTRASTHTPIHPPTHTHALICRYKKTIKDDLNRNAAGMYVPVT